VAALGVAFVGPRSIALIDHIVCEPRLAVLPVALRQFVKVLGHQRGVAAHGARVAGPLGVASVVQFPSLSWVYYDGCRTLTKVRWVSNIDHHRIRNTNS